MPTFRPIVVGSRLSAVRALLLERGHDALIVASTSNVAYLTGFSGSAGYAFVTVNGGVLCVDGRYAEQARVQAGSAGCDLDICVEPTLAAMHASIQRLVASCRSVAYDAHELTLAQFDALGGSTSALRRDDGLVATVRAVKDEAEIERIGFAARCADEALAGVPALVTQGGAVTERDIRDELEYRMRRAGADGPSYDTIVASGEHSARPHHRPTDRRITDGDALVIDVGALVEGYHSDMTRTYLVGECDERLTAMYDAVREVQAGAVAMVRAGQVCGAIDSWCSEEFARRELSDYVAHSTGHGVGLNIHESPWLRTSIDEQLRVNQVVTVEPGLYRVGVGGVRIEDLVVVTQTGNIVLTHSPKESPCLQSPRTT